MKKYLVGGAVRDMLLTELSTDGKYVAIPKDKDYVIVGASHQYMMDTYGEPIGKDFPVWVDGEGNEVAMARVERSTGSRSSQFQFTTDGVTIEDDLLRRDLTINAIALPAEESVLYARGSLVDPYGGLRDIQDKVLRHVSGAFTEDPLRVLRVARFLARYYSQGFRVHESTFELCRTMVSTGMLAHLPKERIWAETLKALGETDCWAFFKFLSDVGFCPINDEKLVQLRYRDKGLHDLMIGTGFMDDFAREKINWALVSEFQMDDVYNAPESFRAVKNAANVLSIIPYQGYEHTVEYVEKLKLFHKSNRPLLTLIGVVLRNKQLFNVIHTLISRCEGLTVDVKPGPEYGKALRIEREKILNDIINPELVKK